MYPEHSYVILKFTPWYKKKSSLDVKIVAVIKLHDNLHLTFELEILQLY